MFDLPPSVVHSTISKMIINEELQVWDIVSFSIIIIIIIIIIITIIIIIWLVLVSDIKGTLIG